MRCGNALDVLDELENALDLFEDDDADRRWADTAACAVEQGDAELLFELGDGRAEGWLGDVVFLGSDGNGVILAGFLEAVELIEFHGDASFH